MQVVSGFISFNPDQGRLYLVNSFIECIQVNIAQLGLEPLLQGGVEMDPEIIRSAQEILIHPGLGFVDCQGSSSPQRCAVQFLGNTLFIDRVPGLMQSPKKRGVEEVFIHPGSDPYVTQAEVGSEGMGCFILPAAVPVVAVFGNGFFTKSPLLGIRVALQRWSCRVQNHPAADHRHGRKAGKNPHTAAAFLRFFPGGAGNVKNHHWRELLPRLHGQWLSLLTTRQRIRW